MEHFPHGDGNPCFHVCAGSKSAPSWSSERVEGWFEEDKGAEGEIITSEFLLPVTHYLRLYMLFEGVPR